MSRVAKSPVTIPSGVEVKLDASNISVKGKKGTLVMPLHKSVEIKQEDGSLVFSAREGAKDGWAMAGTTRSLTNNMVVGVSEGFQRKLILQGVGYRAKANGTSVNLVLGFSHPIDYDLPEGVTVDTPTQTEIVLSGTDKQILGKVAAEIRAFRPPEPYKGKGVRYAEENVRRKEAKKK
ncbi:50S ribosomal protein L6 [Zhongshania aliphaticivorans]|uniref:50S ribosomal protein L6 n=1 Tax=Zhongshania aliphaticivorans TaxID=1470434 RepID=UPI0012E63118|nr:50S ribosomal protein L6 [Zhongshania aliphaticivorans]CAA0116612.1 50S ribosomal protein L6 [Zhongshania aliphaticivorans]